MSILISVALLAPTNSVAQAVPRKLLVQQTAKLLAGHGWGHPETDPALNAAASALALRARPGISAEDAGAHLRFVLAQAKISDHLVTPFTIRHRKGALGQALTGLLARLDHRRPPTHIGMATLDVEGAQETTLLLLHRGITLEQPLPAVAEEGQTLHIVGAVRPGYFNPRLIVAAPGQTQPWERQARGPGRSLRAWLMLDAGPGDYGIELVADSQYGPVILNNHTVRVGAPAPVLPVVRLQPIHETGSPVYSLWSLINAHRQRRGLLALVWSERLEQAARAHARELAGGRGLHHGSPDSGTLATRARALGLPVSVVAENLAVAKDARSALNVFLASPGHARNLALRTVTHIGIARAGQHFVVAMAGLNAYEIGATR